MEIWTTIITALIAPLTLGGAAEGQITRARGCEEEQDSAQALTHNLSELVGLYVSIVE